ncbi:MAG: pyridoxamine 5'-phosphate oxidase family protein [Chloroflexi bacterium]|nr:pyridoxamine 5'-phosphate oxidase family protein [Chloroflexota bacterium]
MPRESIALTHDELVAFASNERWCVVATNDEDGGLWADAAACCVADGTFYFRLPRETRAFANILKDDRVCCILERAPAYYEIKGASIHGKASIVINGMLLGSLIPLLERGGDPVSAGARGDVYSLPLTDVASFDFAKIKAKV